MMKAATLWPMLHYTMSSRLSLLHRSSCDGTRQQTAATCLPYAHICMYIYAIMIDSGGVTHFQRLPLQPNAVHSAAHPTHVVPIKTVPCSAQRSQHSDSQAIFTTFPIFCATLTVYTGRYRPAKQLPQVANASNAKNKITRPFEAPRHAPARRPKRSDIPRHCFSCLRIWVPLEVGFFAPARS